MNQTYVKPLFIAYLVLMAVIGISSNNLVIKAEESFDSRDIQRVEKVYQLEMNHANYEEIIIDILKDDIKYVFEPKSLSNDVVLSELVSRDIDFSSLKKQTIHVDVTRYTESKDGKLPFDHIQRSVSVQFIDTIAPEITLKKSTVSLDEGEEFDPSEYIESITDNSYDDLDIVIDNPVDMDEPGTYIVTVTASDVSKNTSTKSFEVVVNEVIEEVVEEFVESVSVTSRTSLSLNDPAPVYVANGNNVSQTVSLINQHRAARGLHPLILGGPKEMSAIALRAKEASTFVSHSRPDGRYYPTAFTDLGLHHSNVIEVLTYAGNSPVDKVNWWMGSPGHRAALMRSDVTHIVIGDYGKMYAGIVYR